MNVHDLMVELSKCDPCAEVRFFVDWDDRRTVRAISAEDADGTVLLGEDLPPEVHARDFKYE